MKRFSLVTVLILLCLILVYRSFYSLGIIANSDSFLGLNSAQFLKESLFAWNERYNGGIENTFTASLIALGYPTLLNQLNTSMTNAGAVAVVLVVSWIALFFTVSYVVGTRGSKGLLVIFFVLSSYIITSSGNRIFIVSVTNILWGTMFSVLATYLFLRSFHEKSWWKLLLCHVMFAASFIDIASALLLGIFFMLYTLINLILFDQRKDTFIFAIKNIIIGLAFNSYWLIFSVLQGFSKTSKLNTFVSSISDTDDILGYISAISNNAYALLLSRMNYFTSVAYPKFYLPAELVLNAALLVLAAGAIFFVNKEKSERLRKDITVLLIIFFLFVLLGFGPRDPFGLFNYLWKNVSFFRIFRDYFKFHRILQIVNVILASYTFSKIYLTYIRNTRLRLLIVFTSFTFLTLFYPYAKLYKYFKPFIVPNYYFEMANYLKKQYEVGALAVLPTISWHQTYKWSNIDYDMPDPFYALSPGPVYTNLAAYSPGPVHYLNFESGKAISEGNEELFYNLSKIRNIRYVVIRQDFYPPFLEKRARYGNFNISLNYERLIKSIDKFKHVRKVGQYGDLHLYEISDEVFSPVIYSPKEIAISKSDLKHSYEIFNTSSTVIFTSDNSSRDFSDFSTLYEYTSPDITFRKVNPTRYEVVAKNVKGKFPLVLSIAYSDQWKVFINKSREPQLQEKISDEYINLYKNPYKLVSVKSFDKPFFKKMTQDNTIPAGKNYDNWFNKNIVSDDKHYNSNGFSNLWMVDPAEFCSADSLCSTNPDGSTNMHLSIEFQPQKYSYIGMGVTLLLIGILLVFTLVFQLYKFIKCGNFFRHTFSE
jgi:hypothetical protein